jgi:K+-sensing histidine kinase KdpD
MSGIACMFVGTDGPCYAVAEGAVRLAFPGATLLVLPTVDVAVRFEKHSPLELLVLANSDEAGVAEAAAALDSAGLPRWAIVTLGAIPSAERVEAVSLEEWSEPLLARVFRGAVAQHRLLRENERLRGDLRTITHRIMHDLRTPLGGILATAEALEEVLGEYEPSSAELAKPLFDSVDDIKRLIERTNILIRASTNPILKGTVPMGEVVFRVLQSLERQILKKGVVLAQPARWPAVEGVSDWLEAIWANLLVNALQHSKDAARIELGWSQAGDEFKFWVLSFQGSVAPEKLRNLFQPFHCLYQSNATRGLGLSIVQRLVELQGGNCGHEPVPAEGSTFFFKLPTGNKAHQPGARPVAASPVWVSPASPSIPDSDSCKET